MNRFFLLFLALVLVVGCSKKEPLPSKPAASPAGSDQRVILSTTVAPGSAFKMSVRFDPPQPVMSKKTTFHLTLTDASDTPVNDASVQASLVMPLMDMGKNQFVLHSAGKGQYEGTGQFTMSGEWEVVIGAEQGGKSGKTTFNVRVED